MVLHNNNMELVLVSKTIDKAMFARINNDGSIYDYVVGVNYRINGDTVEWCWGHYDMTYEQAMKFTQED